MTRATANARGAFCHFSPITTRWADNDAYGHVNNVAYYGFFDTAINGWLIERGLLDVGRSEAIGLVVETGCQFFSPLHYPQPIEAGICVTRIGRSSVRYEVGIFAAGADVAAAQGHFVHVYVDRASRTTIAIPPHVRAALQQIARVTP